MFWGVTLESGKRYSQVVESSYHLSMAALEPNIKEVGKSNKYVSVMIEHGKSEFLLCTLEYDRIMQVPLDLVFVEGEEVSFFLNGEGVVHLTGYVTDERQDVDEQSYSEESEEENETSEDYSSKLMHVDDSTDDSSNEEWIPEKLNKKNINIKNNKTSKKLNKEFKMKSNITSNYKKTKFKNEEDKNNQYKNSEELKEIHDDGENTESYEEIEMSNEEINKYFNPKNKKKLKKHKKLALHKNKLTSSPISAPQVPEDMLNEEKSCLSLKKSKKINNKQKFFKKEKPYSEEEREKFQKNVLSTKKKHPKKKQYKSGGGTDI